MAKRVSLQAKPSSVLRAAANARENPTTAAANGNEKFKTTGVSFPPTILELLSDVAVKRRKLHGGRASVSAILLELVEKHRGELEAELKG